MQRSGKVNMQRDCETETLGLSDIRGVRGLVSCFLFLVSIGSPAGIGR